MWTDRQQTMPFRYWLKALALCLLLGLPLVSGAVTLAQETPAASPGDEDLRRQIEQRYQVLPIHGGILLTPKAARRGVRTIEVSGDAVAINGERVNAQIARDWLGQDADLILPLLSVDPVARRALFGLAAEAEPPPGARDEAEATPAPESGGDETPEEIEIPEPPDAPDTPEVPERVGEPSIQSGSRVNILGSIVVEKGELAEEAVAVGGSVRVDGEVSRDVVAIGGPARINGRVGGDVVAVGGSVHLGPEAVVEGDVNSVGGRIDRAKGARIHGSTSEVSPWRGSPWRDARDFDPDFGPFSLFGTSLEVFGSTVKLVVLALLTCLVLLLARRPLERVEAHLRTEPWKAALTGLSGVLLFFPLLAVVTVLLVITIIGCALLLLYPFLFLALALAALFGYAAVAYRVGRWLESRFSRSFGGPYAAALVGVLAIQIWSVIGQLLALGPGPLDMIALMFMLLAALVQVSAWVVGFGAVLLARFGAPPRPMPPTAIAPVPPPPPAPTYGGNPDLPLTGTGWEEPPER